MSSLSRFLSSRWGPIVTGIAGGCPGRQLFLSGEGDGERAGWRTTVEPTGDDGFRVVLGK